MGIRFPCHVCNKRLNVKAFLAGKRGICPHCGTKVDIPWQSVDASDADDPDESYVPTSVSPGTHSAGSGNGQSTTRPKAGGDMAEGLAPTVPVGGRAGQASGSPGMIPVSGSPAGSGTSQSTEPVETSSPPSPEPPPVSGPADPIDEAPNAVWYVRPPTGGQFGPASGEIMRRWITEGRVSADSLVWREGWADWKAANTLFSDLAGGTTTASPSPPASFGGSASSPTPKAAPTSPMGKDGPAGTAARPYGRRRNNNALAIGMVVVLSLASLALLGVLIAVTMS